MPRELSAIVSRVPGNPSSAKKRTNRPTAKSISPSSRSAILQDTLVSNDLSLETSCTDFPLCERRDDHGLSSTAERCGSGAADAGEVVAIGSSDPLDYAEVAEPAKLA